MALMINGRIVLFVLRILMRMYEAVGTNNMLLLYKHQLPALSGCLHCLQFSNVQTVNYHTLPPRSKSMQSSLTLPDMYISFPINQLHAPSFLELYKAIKGHDTETLKEECVD